MRCCGIFNPLQLPKPTKHLPSTHDGCLKAHKPAHARPSCTSARIRGQGDVLAAMFDGRDSITGANLNIEPCIPKATSIFEL